MQPTQPLFLTLVYSHVTFEGSLDDQKVVDEVGLYVRASSNGPVNVRIIETEDEILVREIYYTAWLDGRKLWLDRRHDHDRRKGEERRESTREKERRKRNGRRCFDLGHMSEPLKITD